MSTASAALSEASASEGSTRAVIIDAPGSRPRVGRTRVPPRTPGTTLVSVVAAPLNPLDLAIASGTFHSVRHEGAYVPGSECVGVVVASTSCAPGTWVYAECNPSPLAPGPMADRVLVQDGSLVELPDGLDPVVAAAVGNAGTAAYMPLVEVAGVRAGETVLVLGATGAVGQLAVQVARLQGAGRVIGVGRDETALNRLIELGADAVIDLRPDESVDDLAERLREAAGAVDVVLDGLYGFVLEAAVRVCAPGARIVNIGNAAGATAQVPAGLLRGRQLTLTGFAGLHTPFAAKRPALTWLWSALASGDLSLPVHTCGYDGLAAAWEAQATSPRGKCVLVPDDVQHLTSTSISDVPTRHGSEN